MSNFVRQVERAIVEHGLLPPQAAILVAVSGGVDSMVLLHVLHRLALAKIVVAHFNHRLRGRSSDADQRLVQRTAKALGLKCVVDRGDVKQFAAENKISLEMAARNLRHEFLAKTAERLQLTTVAFAHHLDDQVELFYLRLLRGSGADGLAGMRWASPSPANPQIRLIRPLLDCSKDELLAYAQAEGIPFREDASNLSTDHWRNRVRLELLPLLKQRLNPRIVTTTRRVMKLVGAEGDFAEQAATAWLAAPGKTPFRRLHLAVQRRCIRAQLFRWVTAPDYELVEWLRLNPGQAISIGPGEAVVSDGEGRIRREHVQTEQGSDAHVLMRLDGLKGSHPFGGLTLNWAIRAHKGKLPRYPASFETFDADRVGAGCYLRHWQPGDRFQPIGMAQPVKLQDWFTNLKIPREKRHQLVLATTLKGEIFWVEDLRIGEQFKLDKASTRQLKWTWHRTR